MKIRITVPTTQLSDIQVVHKLSQGCSNLKRILQRQFYNKVDISTGKINVEHT